MAGIIVARREESSPKWRCRSSAAAQSPSRPAVSPSC